MISTIFALNVDLSDILAKPDSNLPRGSFGRIYRMFEKLVFKWKFSGFGCSMLAVG